MITFRPSARPVLTVPKVQVRAEVLTLIAAVGAGLLIRLRYVLAAGFPLNDGGMFYVMTRELQRSHYLLPHLTSYNHLNIPFAYPPLGFYASGIFADLSHLSLLTVFRILPLIVNMLSIGAFYLLSRAVLPSRRTIVISVLLYVVLPESFVWFLMGGSITRSFGDLFAMLALWQIFSLYRRPSKYHLCLATVLTSLTALSHLEATYFLALSSALLLVFYGRSWKGVINSFVVFAGASLLAAPWWLTILIRDGVSPFVNAFHTNGTVLSGLLQLTQFNGAGEALFPILAALALVGSLVCWRRGEFFLPCWLIAIVVLDSRGGHMYAAIPLAMLAALGITDALAPLLSEQSRGIRALTERETTGATHLGAPSRERTWMFRGLVILLTYATLSALVTAPATLGALTGGQRQAMQWVAENTAPSGRFLIVTGMGSENQASGLGEDSLFGWGRDRTVEWFPAIAGRASVDTPQGREWLPGFLTFQERYYDVQRCSDRDVACLENWSQEADAPFTYVYLPKGADAGSIDSEGCCWALRNALRHDRTFATVYDGPGASVFARRVGQ